MIWGKVLRPTQVFQGKDTWYMAGALRAGVVQLMD
jgi:hypothetical protein